MLSRGKHRHIRKGACFMEMASLLAGERWSDHPACTHPLLAETARLVNDCTSDDERHHLAVLIPSVVGLRSDDQRMDALIALRCAQVALPVVCEERQNLLAVGVLTADALLARLEGRPHGSLELRSSDALDAVPHAARWARQLVRRGDISAKTFRRHGAPGTVRVSVTGIAQACIADPDGLLRQLLTDVIADCEALCDRERAVRNQPPQPEERVTAECGGKGFGPLTF